MSILILMKIFEVFPRRYDKGIRLLTLGRLEKAYDRLIGPIKKGDRVLDIGCGTGALTIRAARKGARVKGIDINACMLNEARIRAGKAKLAPNIEFSEMGVAELGNEEEESFDVVTSGLCFSELGEDEFRFALSQIKRLLRPGGILLVADEVWPKNPFKKVVHWLFRSVLRSVVYILTGTRTRALKNLPERIEESGFEILSLRKNKGENFVELMAKNSAHKGK